MRASIRILLPLASAAFLAPAILAQRTDVARMFPLYDNGGKPDLTIDPKRVDSQLEIVDRLFDANNCAIAEGVVGGPGYRRLLRFDTVILNRGGGDVVIGNRSDPNNPYASFFQFHTCHGHYHLRDFSIYELVTLDGQTVKAGTKQGFCLEDSFKYDGQKSKGYDCEFQGITQGWGDWYYKQLVGQWIDITGVPAGDYILRVSINTGGMVDEGENRHPNVYETRVKVPDPRKKVAEVTD